ISMKTLLSILREICLHIFIMRTVIPVFLELCLHAINNYHETQKSHLPQKMTFVCLATSYSHKGEPSLPSARELNFRVRATNHDDRRISASSALARFRFLPEGICSIWES